MFFSLFKLGWVGRLEIKTASLSNQKHFINLIMRYQQPKKLPEKLTPTVAEFRNLRGLIKLNPKFGISFLEGTKQNDRTEERVHFQVDTDKLSIAVYPYRNNLR